MTKSILESVITGCLIMIALVCAVLLWIMVAAGVVVVFDFIMGTDYFSPVSVGIVALILFLGRGL